MQNYSFVYSQGKAQNLTRRRSNNPKFSTLATVTDVSRTELTECNFAAHPETPNVSLVAGSFVMSACRKVTGAPQSFPACTSLSAVARATIARPKAEYTHVSIIRGRLIDLLA